MSFSPGDKVFLCGPNGPVEAIFVKKVGPDCVIRVDGQVLPVLCRLLHDSPNACPIDQGALSIGERVALQITDSGGVTRAWPATVRKIYANGRIQIMMEGLSSPQTVDRPLLVRLGTT